MKRLPLRQDKRGRPLVAVIWSVPLVSEAVRMALEFVELAEFPGRVGDVSGLLEWLQPDALVVDSEEVAATVTAYAMQHDLPVLHIMLDEDAIRLFRAGAWARVGSDEGATPEAVRNVVAGVLYAGEVER